jgi:hypothetical protein
MPGDERPATNARATAPEQLRQPIVSVSGSVAAVGGQVPSHSARTRWLRIPCVLKLGSAVRMEIAAGSPDAWNK